MSQQKVKNGLNVTCWDWDDGQICWNDNPYYWDDVCIAEEVEEIAEAGGGDAGSWIGALDELEPKKRKRFITLIANVTGEEIKETKEVKDIEATAKNIKLTVEKLKSVKLKVK